MEEIIMINTIISAAAAILGTIIGVCVTLAIHRIDRKSNERKIINESIHYLLEVYYHVNRINAGKMMIIYYDYYLKRIKKIIPEFDDKSIEIAKNHLSDIIKASLVPIARQSFDELDDLGEQYETMVAKLATIMPIDAYYLRGKNDFGEMMQTTSEYFKSIKASDNNSTNYVNEFIDKMQPSITKDIINDYREDLKLELNNLLKRTNYHNRRKGKKVIKRLESEMLTEKEKKKIDSLVENIAEAMKYNGKQPKAQ